MTATTFVHWRVCDDGFGGKRCLYSERHKRDRCIKHGSILCYAQWLYGLDRKEARAALDAAAARR